MKKKPFLLHRPEEQRFLVVDDELFIVELIKDYLETLGFSCETAYNGKEALEKFVTNGHFTIVITDICMPEMDGLELIKAIKKDWPDTDIIAITAYTKNYKYTDVIRAGANDFINKPFDLDELQAKINRILRERELRERLRALTIHDPLTDIYNRRYFEEKIEEECYRAWRQKYEIHLVMLDVDHFKEYNDHYGHQAGDRLLQKLAEIMIHSTRRFVDLPFRYGGDEFALLIPQCDIYKAKQAAERIRQRFLGCQFDPTTISAGVARFKRSHPDKVFRMDVDDLIRRADEALYEAKRQGGNCVLIDPESC